MPDPMIIAVTGPTSAGKTYFADSLTEAAKKADIRSARISTDEFYRDQSHLSMEERKHTNYDNPSSINHQEFIQAIANIANHRPAKIPVYDLTTHTRTGEYRTIEQIHLLLVEGIFTLSFTELLQYYDMKIYVDLASDLRLIRRIKRDMSERGRSLKSVVTQYISTVRPTQSEFVKRDREKADMILLGDKDHSVVRDMIVTSVATKIHQSKLEHH